MRKDDNTTIHSTVLPWHNHIICMVFFLSVTFSKWSRGKERERKRRGGRETERKGERKRERGTEGKRETGRKGEREGEGGTEGKREKERE